MQFVDNAGRTLKVTFGHPNMMATVTVSGPNGQQDIGLTVGDYRALGERLIGMAKLASSQVLERKVLNGTTSQPLGVSPVQGERNVIVQLKEGPVADSSPPMGENFDPSEWGEDKPGYF